MKILILGGFLGSGKTTVLMQLARFLVARSNASGTPVVILENEISDKGVDNQLLSSQSFTVKNLFSGCACCTSSEELGYSIQRLKDLYAPQWLIVEATGMACPDRIRDSIQEKLSMSADVVALVDTVRWARVVRAMKQFVTAQLNGAAVVLQTKVDLADSETVDAVSTSVREYAPDAAIYPICALERQPDAFWEEILCHTATGDSPNRTQN